MLTSKYAYLTYMPKRMATIKIMTDISKLFAKSSDIKILTGLKGLFITLLEKKLHFILVFTVSQSI